MTNLTEHKGNKTHYYIKFPNNEVIIGDEFALSLYRNCKDGDKVEVLGEVPSYESWKKHRKVTAETQIKNCDLEIINTKLKELLKTHKLLFELEKDNTKNVLQRGKYAYLIKDIDQVLGEE